METAEQIEVPLSVQAIGFDAVSRYLHMLQSGQAPKMAEMLACRTPPGTSGTDSAFMQGRINNEQLGEMHWWSRQQLLGQAKKAGIDINGKVYIGQLADGRMGGDPDAWVSSNSDVLKACKKKLMNCEGSVNHEIKNYQPPKAKALSERAIKRFMNAELKKDPSQATDLKKLREKVIENHAPHWKKGSK